MKKYKVAFVGCGARSTTYARPYAESDEIEITAIADSSELSRDGFLKACGLEGKGIPYYRNNKDLLREHKDLDGAVICTPNYLHAETAIPFIERGIPVALEKPMNTTMKDGEAILEAERASGARVLIGFVLRSTPFYKKIHELIAGGAVGKVVAIEADELASYGETSTISRRPWRRYSKFSGGALMEKSSHDLDIINWLTGSRPAALNSFADTLVFNPNPLLPQKCADCKIEDCVYRSKGPGFYPPDDLECIYNVDKDVIDNQCVNIRYENGIIASFIMCFNTTGEKAGRNIHIIGQKGRLWGNHEEKSIFVFDNAAGKTTKYETATDASGHGGGDRKHAMELLKMMKDPEYRPAQGSYAGYLSSAMCIAADSSSAENRRISFRYDSKGYMSFV